jgi:hypothetical protein
MGKLVFCENEEEDSSLIGMPLLPIRKKWEQDSLDEESDFEDEPPPPFKELMRDLRRFGPRRSVTPQTLMHLLKERLLI